MSESRGFLPVNSAVFWGAEGQGWVKAEELVQMMVEWKRACSSLLEGFHYVEFSAFP